MDELTPNCGTCRFWVKFRNDSEDGDCARYPPTVFYVDDVFEAEFPQTHYDLWCGEHQPKP